MASGTTNTAASATTTSGDPAPFPVNINQTSSAGAKMCFFADYLYIAYEKDGVCWLSRSPDGEHWQDTRAVGIESMDPYTVPALATSDGILLLAYASNGSFIVMGTEDGWKWEIHQVVQGSNLNTKGGITMAATDEVYIVWVNQSSWTMWMIHSIGGISGDTKWTPPSQLIYYAAGTVGCPPTIANFHGNIYLIYQEYGGVGQSPQPDSPAPTDLYWAQYDGTKWTFGPRIPIDANPGNPCVVCPPDNQVVVVYTKRDTDMIYAKTSADGVTWGAEMSLVKGKSPGLGVYGFSPDPFMVFNDSTSELWVTFLLIGPTTGS